MIEFAVSKRKTEYVDSEKCNQTSLFIIQRKVLKAAQKLFEEENIQEIMVNKVYDIHNNDLKYLYNLLLKNDDKKFVDELTKLKLRKTNS